MSSINDALKKAQERAAKKMSSNRGRRPYDIAVAGETKTLGNAHLLSGTNSEIVRAPVRDSDMAVDDRRAAPQENKIHSNDDPVGDTNASEGSEPRPQQQLQEVTKPTLSLDNISPDVLHPSQQIDDERGGKALVEQGTGTEKQNADDDLLNRLEAVTQENSLKYHNASPAEKSIDEYMQERGWNKVPHSIQKWALKTLKGNDLKGMYYFIYLSIRSGSPVISVGYAAIASALGTDKRVGPKRIVQNLIRKGALVVEAEATPKTSAKYKIVPMELLLQQDPEFFKKVRRAESQPIRNIDADVVVLKNYLLSNFDSGEAGRVLPKYKFILEDFSASEVIELIDSVSSNGIFGMKASEIGNVNSLLTSKGTFAKAFNSHKFQKAKSDKASSQVSQLVEDEKMREEYEREFAFKVSQAKQYLLTKNEDMNTVLNNLKDKYRSEQRINSSFFITDETVLVHYYESITSGQKNP